MNPNYKRPRGFGLAAVLAVVLLASACHDESDVKVSSLKFSGNQAFQGKDLSKLMVTQASGWLPWSRPHFFNRSVFDDDLDRLVAFYSDRGYPDARVASVDVQFNKSRNAVSLKVIVEEGAPRLVEKVEFTGLEEVAPDVVERLQSLPIRAGAPRDRQAVAASRERATFILKDSGYAFARVESVEKASNDPRQVIITFEVKPGPLTTFGETSVVGVVKVKPLVVQRTLTFRPGELYRVSRITESQRRLFSLGIFDFAHVTSDPKVEVPQSTLPMIATVAEGKPQRYQFGVGYGSEDGPRGSVKWEHLNFLGDARRFSAEARYASRLRGAGIDFVEPHLLTRKWSFNTSFGGWWTDEPTHFSRRIGGRMGVTFRTESGRGPDVEPTKLIMRAGYLADALDYTVDDRTLADLTQFDQLLALGLDPVTGKGHGRLTGLEFDLERTMVDHPTDPRSGQTVALHARHVAPWLGGSYRYDELQVEGRVYVPLGERYVWANRARIGAIFSKPTAAVPVSERYFLGGSVNMRGWGRYQVAPLTTDGLPLGGRGMLDLSTEIRVPLRGSFGGVIFLDAGNSWQSPGEITVTDLYYAAGPGLRWMSPVGVVRADFAYQLKRIPGLRVDGEPERLRWRIHFSIGHTF